MKNKTKNYIFTLSIIAFALLSSHTASAFKYDKGNIPTPSFEYRNFFKKPSYETVENRKRVHYEALNSHMTKVRKLADKKLPLITQIDGVQYKGYVTFKQEGAHAFYPHISGFVLNLNYLKGTKCFAEIDQVFSNKNQVIGIYYSGAHRGDCSSTGNTHLDPTRYYFQYKKRKGSNSGVWWIFIDTGNRWDTRKEREISSRGILKKYH